MSCVGIFFLGKMLLLFLFFHNDFFFFFQFVFIYLLLCLFARIFSRCCYLLLKTKLILPELTYKIYKLFFVWLLSKRRKKIYQIIYDYYSCSTANRFESVFGRFYLYRQFLSCVYARVCVHVFYLLNLAKKYEIYNNEERKKKPNHLLFSNLYPETNDATNHTQTHFILSIQIILSFIFFYLLYSFQSSLGIFSCGFFFNAHCYSKLVFSKGIFINFTFFTNLIVQDFFFFGIVSFTKSNRIT